MERKKTNEIYIFDFKTAMEVGRSTGTRGTSFLWDDVVHITESKVFSNCTSVKTVYTEFTINEQFDVVDGEWNAYIIRQKLGINTNHE